MSIDELPYVHAAGDGGPRQRTQIVVIHATDNTASDEGEAAYASHRPDKTSAHFYNDGDSVIRALPLNDVAYGCLPHGNAISVQFELCGLSDQLADQVLREVAPVVAEVCRRYNIPVAHPEPGPVRAGARGIVGHDTVTAAFPEDHGTHTDPGPHFPWETFLRYVAGAGGHPIVDPPFPGRYLRLHSPYMTGSDVRTAQARLSVRGWRIDVDGVFGPQTDRVVRAFQADKHLDIDGIIGPVTWGALWTAPIT